ncbi:hypothetical protein SAMN05192558_12179 [Actinokineospora alba]|uniref:Uncharacterized protein n=1 Tax=Actinokineospora alba TaxID=504798 RepID=A0A1H0WIJ5_9PSEU|nr:hypothetical protein [Actinokineospora alba]TDP65355.1 hypothetical protein C8E96_0837 [Actinokineospora alba]SDH60319.1 hypothetical protein SAMN05421871_101659 [Actinokineospora alba]SDP90096.1 hypothetical protein SAMN05192558_12179 [Actinokineospora alba]
MGQSRNDDGTFGESDGEGNGKGKAAAGLVALGTAGAIAMSAVGGGAAASGGAGAGGVAAESAGLPGNFATRVSKGKKSARKGKADDAWRDLNVSKLKDPAKKALDCAVNSYGQVRNFFLRNPCKTLDRQLFTLADTAGNNFVVSVSWVRMRDRGDVSELKTLIDTDGTGSVAPLGFAVLKSQGVRFTGVPFKSDPKGNVLVVAEAAVASGKPDPALMEAAVEIAVELPG